VLVGVGVCLLGYAVSLAVLGVVSSGNNLGIDRARILLVISSMMIGVVYVAGLWRFRRCRSVSRRGLLVILLIGLGARCVVSIFPPFLEDDFYRYMLDGAVTANGLNPYRVVPNRLDAGDSADAPGDDIVSKITATGHETIARINHPYLATIYPPVAQAVFATAYLIKPWSVYALRGVLFVFDVGTFVLLLILLRHLRMPAQWVVWYWWNPVLLREVSSSAHMDVILFPFILGAILLMLRGRVLWGSVVLLVAVGTKLWPLLLAPVMLRVGSRRTRQFLAGSMIMVAGSACVVWPILAGSQADEGGLTSFARLWHSNEGFFAIWSYAAGVLLPRFSIHGDDIERCARLGVALLVGCWAVFCAIRPIRDGAEMVSRILGVVAAIFLLGPTQFPWYSLWMLPLFCIRMNPALLLYSVTLPLYYLQYEHPFVLWIEHLPVWIALVGMWVLNRKKTRMHTRTS